MTEDAASCAAEARRHAYDDYIASLYAPESARSSLQALAAFAATTQAAALSARDPIIGAIRVAWWREALRGERDGELAGDPVARTLRAAVSASEGRQALVESMLDARGVEIRRERLSGESLLANYADKAEGARLRLASMLAGGEDAEAAAAPAGLALAITRLLTLHAVALLPEDRGETLVIAERALAAARREIIPLRGPSRAVFRPLAAAAADLAAFRSAGEGDLVPASSLRRLWAMWRAG